jgi:hypothetical protein
MPTNTDDLFSVMIDKQTVAMVEDWARRSAFQPSRRAAVRAIIRIGLKHVNRHEHQERIKKIAAAASAPTTETHAS